MEWSTDVSCRLLLKVITLICAVISRKNGVAANRNMFSEGAEQFTGSDVSGDVFGVDVNDVFPVAYFDINSDKLTDMIGVSRERISINVFLAMDKPPYLQRAFHSNNITKEGDQRIVSIRPGDFTGNGMPDLMVTLGKDYGEENSTRLGEVEVLFCTVHIGKQFEELSLECGGPGSGGVIKKLAQEPMVLDANGDMVLDLIGEMWVPASNPSWKKQRMVWFSESTKDSFEWKPEVFHVSGSNEALRDMTNVSSNAYADIDGDSIPELIILTEDANVPRGNGVYYIETFEIFKDEEEHIEFSFKNGEPEMVDTTLITQVIGQPMILDFEHNGKLEQLFPYCTDYQCNHISGIYVMDQGNALPLPLGSLMYGGSRWGFIPPQKPLAIYKNNSVFSMENFYSRALSLRVGDYNLDGYPDLLGVLKTEGKPGDMRSTRAVLFENVRCVPAPESPCHYNRTFKANFEIFKDYQNVISASFYDISDNGALDVILVTLHEHEQAPQNQRFVIHAFENNMNFDASFLKVMVLTGQECLQCDGGTPYGNVLPGATVRYTSLNTKGIEESGVAVQTYRTSHIPLDLPCNVFGIGHSPNFIESMSVAIAPNKAQVYQRNWKQIIPNSQIVVAPNPLERPSAWTMKLFLTPSDVVLKTFGILVGVCLVLATLASALEFKERWEDRLARQSEAHRMVLWLS